jgi:predicted permease
MKFALRQLAKSPGFTIVAVLSLAIGIGANTAVFSLMNAVLLQMMPVKNPEALVVFNSLSDENVGPSGGSSGWRQREAASSKMTSTSFSMHTFEQFRTHAQTLSDVFAFAPMFGLNVNVDGTADVVQDGQVVSGNYHTALGVSAAVGRLITPADDDPAAEPVAVISFRYWQRRFGGEPNTVGRQVTINGVPVTIIGVTAPRFKGTGQVGEATDVFLPLALESRLMRRTEVGLRPGFWWLRIMGRLKPGVSAEQACASLEGIFHETVKDHIRQRTAPGAPAIEPGKVPLPSLRAAPGGQGLYEARRQHERSIRLLMGLVGLVLLVACANVANLLLARGTARRREIAVRLALGASRGRLVRQLLAESVLLAGVSAGVGLLFAIWGVRALVAMGQFGASQSTLDTSLDWRVLGFTTAIAIATGIFFGLMPAMRATRLNLSSEFQGGTRTLGSGSRSALAKTLMVVQVALSLVLLIGAGLFVRTLQNLQNVDVGFNRERLLLFQVNAGANGATPAQALATYDRMRDRIAQIPGVQRAAFSRVAPLSGSNWTSGVKVPGYVPTQHESVPINGIDAEYFATLELRLLLGRNFTSRDATSAPKVAVVNQTFARKFFGEENVIGRRIGFSGRESDANIEIVGLLRDARYSNVKGEAPSIIFVPYAQIPGNQASPGNFAVRFAGEAATITTAIRAAVREVDSTLPITNIRTQVEQLDRMFAQERVFANLCSFFGVVALGLSAIGLYGLMSYTVVRRTGEIGLRMALGALPGHVLRMIVRESLGLVVLGALIGIAAALGATRWISSMLFGLSSTDPTTYIAVTFLLIVVALFACFLPARRAAKVDPMVALRTE